MDIQPIAVPQSLAYVLNTAGDKSNVDFDYLLNTAMRESSLNPEAKASSSSAVGLFQFLDTTWLQVMKEEGPRLGYQKYADAITRDSSGDYVVRDKALRSEILKLREDPQVAADMAAAFTQANGEYLEARFGRMPSPGELYIAHFLGPQGAEKMFNAGLDNPDQIAAKLFPKQAKANRQIFYSGTHARTIREVYRALVATHNAIGGGSAAPVPAPQPMFVAQQLAGSDATGAAGADAPPITPAAMSFAAMFATSATRQQTQPLIGSEPAGPLMAMAPAEAARPIAAAGSSIGPLAAIDAAAGPATSLADVPLPAPAPLVAPAPSSVPVQPVQPATADGSPAPLSLLGPTGPVRGDADTVTGTAAIASSAADETAIPQARIEMTPGVRPNSAFFTQLVWTEEQFP